MSTAMKKSRNAGSTSSSITKTYSVQVNLTQHKGFFGHNTRIHNHTKRDIFLIPICCTATGDALRTGTVENVLVKKIPAEQSIEVKIKKYFNLINPEFQINIFFRAADKIEEFLKDFHKKRSQLQDQLFDVHKLYNQDLDLYNNEEKATVNAGQGTPEEDTAETLKKSELQSMIRDLQTIQENLKILKDMDFGKILTRMESLLNGFLPRANLDPSFSINTPSSAK